MNWRGCAGSTTSNNEPNRKESVQLCRTMKIFTGRGADTNNTMLEMNIPIHTKQ